jgi:hypothetical protein
VLKISLRLICLSIVLNLLAGCGSTGPGTETDTGKKTATNSPPTIAITGDPSVSVKLGETYVDAGATAHDDEDGDLTDIIVTDSNVDTSSAGIYQVNYSVIDSGGAGAQATRIVQVAPTSADGNVSVGWESKFSLPDQDENGWSLLTPSADSRLIYVASSGGDNGTARTYLPGDAEIGDDPFNPAGEIRPYATIDAALTQARDGYPDYILLKRGNIWERDAGIAMKAGRSVDERAVLGYYGADPARPMVRNNGVNLDDASYSAVIGIRFTASRRNPDSADFVGLANVTNIQGFHVLGGYGNSVVGGLLIEDCWFDWFSGNTLQSPEAGGGPVLTDVIIRRNIITNNYSTLSHSQGIFSAYASVLLEENVFDHNGWYRQAYSGATQADGVATMFNHNTYFAESRDTIFRNNLFMRSASINNKFTSNTASGTNEVLAWNILLNDNLYIDGEIGISLGGNDDQDNGPRWRDIYITNNVMMHIGRSQPTNRTLGWGLDVDDWDGGLVKGNIFTGWGDDAVRNTYAIHAQGHTTGVEYSDNIAFNVAGGQPLVQFLDGGIHSGVAFFGNEIQGSDRQRLLLYALTETGGFHDNYYYSEADESEWFSATGARYTSLADYRALSGDHTSVAGTRNYADPGRTIETYLADLGYSPDMDSFAAELKKQSKFNWRGELTAKAINAHIREGFCISGDPNCR